MADGHDLNRVAAFAEGKLAAAERSRMIAHLASCAECRAIVAALVRGGAVGESVAGRDVARPRWSPLAAFRLPMVASLPIAATLVIALVGLGLFRARTAPHIAAPSVAPAGVPVPPDRAEDLATRRDVPVREVGGKRFRLLAGEWIDTEYDAAAARPVVIPTTAEQRSELLARVRGLKAFGALGDRFTVVLNGTVYRFGEPSSR